MTANKTLNSYKAFGAEQAGVPFVVDCSRHRKYNAQCREHTVNEMNIVAGPEDCTDSRKAGRVRTGLHTGTKGGHSTTHT